MMGKSICRDYFAQLELMPHTLGRSDRQASVVFPDNHDTPVQSETSQETEPTLLDNLVRQQNLWVNFGSGSAPSL